MRALVGVFGIVLLAFLRVRAPLPLGVYYMIQLGSKYALEVL